MSLLWDAEVSRGAELGSPRDASGPGGALCCEIGNLVNGDDLSVWVVVGVHLGTLWGERYESLSLPERVTQSGAFSALVRSVCRLSSSH